MGSQTSLWLVFIPRLSECNRAFGGGAAVGSYHGSSNGISLTNLEGVSGKAGLIVSGREGCKAAVERLFGLTFETVDGSGVVGIVLCPSCEYQGWSSGLSAHISVLLCSPAGWFDIGAGSSIWRRKGLLEASFVGGRSSRIQLVSAGVGDVDRFDRWLSNDDLGVTSEGRIWREGGRDSEFTVVFFVEIPPLVLKGGKVSALDPPFSGVQSFSVSALLRPLSLRH